jgi:hypothetical protein
MRLLASLFVALGLVVALSAVVTSGLDGTRGMTRADAASSMACPANMTWDGSSCG